MEQDLARAVIEHGPRARRIVADGARLFGPLRKDYPNVEALNHADRSCPVVAAASIVAKDERDRVLRAILAPLEQELGSPIAGGGYVNRGTETFLRTYVDRFGTLPGEVRHSWSWQVLDELGRDPAAGLPLFSVPRGRDKNIVDK
jgi:ribonuclease HII